LPHAFLNVFGTPGQAVCPWPFYEYIPKKNLKIPNLDKPEPKRFSDSLAKITRKSEIRI